MAAPVDIINVEVLNNDAAFQSPFQFLITFSSECELKEDLDWTLTYVGNAEDTKMDQQLDNISVGPVGVGTSKFLFEAPPPDWTQIKPEDLVDVTVVFIQGSYRDKEWIRVGYYVRNFYEPGYEHEEGQPVNIDKVKRLIDSDHPRVYRVPHHWDGEPVELPAIVPTGEPEPIEEHGGDDYLMDEDESEEEDSDGDMDREIDLSEDRDASPTANQPSFNRAAGFTPSPSLFSPAPATPSPHYTHGGPQAYCHPSPIALHLGM